MRLLFMIVADGTVFLVVFAVITEVVFPLFKRQLTFPFFRKLVNKISRPKPNKPKQKTPSK